MRARCGDARLAAALTPATPLCARLTRVVHRCAVLLMVLLLPFAGPRWAVIAQSLEGRTDDAVRNRYLRLYKKLPQDLSQRDSLKKGDMWTTQEDDLINDGVQRYGQKWHVIADFLPGRSANAVRTRYLRQTAKQEGGASASHHPVATTQVVAPALVVAPTELAEDPSVATMQVEATHLVHAMVAASEIATAAAEVATAAAEVAEVAAATAELAAPE